MEQTHFSKWLRQLMNRNDKKKPLCVAYVIGTFSAAPLTVACMNEFLKWLKSPDADKAYHDSRVLVKDWMVEMNAALEKENATLRAENARLLAAQRSPAAQQGMGTMEQTMVVLGAQVFAFSREQKRAFAQRGVDMVLGPLLRLSNLRSSC